MQSHNKPFLFYFIVSWTITQIYACGPPLYDPWIQQPIFLRDSHPCVASANLNKWQIFENKQDAIDFASTAPVDRYNDESETVVSNVNVSEVVNDDYGQVVNISDEVQDGADVQKGADVILNSYQLSQGTSVK